ncbi:hypothetical protein OAU93_02305 [bacterium]|jgi:hypothetical protein|nr:hypothetical protein [bacterium]
MHTIWGIVTALIGVLMLLGGTTKSDFVVYRILTERSKQLWGENVHRFYQCAGFAVFVVGVLVATEVIGR